MSLLLAASLAACAGGVEPGAPLPTVTPLPTVASAGGTSTRGENVLVGAAPRAWAREGLWLFQALDAQPIGMSRDGRRVLEVDGTLWLDDGGATTTVVHTVDGPVALSGGGAAVIGQPSSGACPSLSRWTTAGLDTIAFRGAGGGVSADGQVVVGTTAGGCASASPKRALVWSDAGATTIAPLASDDDQTEALAVSADGATLIGFSSSASTLMGSLFSWRASTGTSPLAETRILRPCYDVFVSDDGERVAGTLVDAGGAASAFRWAADSGDGLRILPRLASRRDTFVIGLSADGSVVLALGTDGGNGMAFTWSEAGGPELLAVPDGVREFQALAMSADASLIVGQPVGVDTVPLAWDATRAPRWLFADAPAFVAACKPHVTALSADGKTVAGGCNAPGGRPGFVGRLP